MGPLRVTRSERFRENLGGWLLLAVAYGVAMVATMAATKAGDFAEIVILAFVSTLVFCAFSFATLFRYRRVSRRIAIVIGSVIGSGVCLVTWFLWRNIEPSFRHAVPIELLPMFVLPVVSGVVVGVGLYFASLRSADVGT